MNDTKQDQNLATDAIFLRSGPSLQDRRQTYASRSAETEIFGFQITAKNRNP